MNIKVEDQELNERVRLNYQRLCEPYYRIEQVFQGKDASWPGDKEGRALLAFVSHYKISGKKIECMEQMMNLLPQMTNEGGYFGPKYEGGRLFEQQLSGHSWYLRGLCEYYECFHKEEVLDILKRVFRTLYLPTAGRFASYPLERDKGWGDVSGTSCETQDGWLLSTDIGCAFMSIDGLSHYYSLTKSPEARALTDEMIDVFCGIDKEALGAQTHCTLTAARGMVRMYDATGERRYLDEAEKIFRLYTQRGMTLTYQNFNWFGREDSWTEPCAIVDSFMLAHMLDKRCGDTFYHDMAVKIYHNGWRTIQRPNGGAGPDTTVCTGRPVLKQHMYEAQFCCTMRLAEGLWYLSQCYQEITAKTSGAVIKDEYGRYMDGDLVYSQTKGICRAPEQSVMVDGLQLAPLVHTYRLSDDEMNALEQQILF